MSCQMWCGLPPPHAAFSRLSDRNTRVIAYDIHPIHAFTNILFIGQKIKRNKEFIFYMKTRAQRRAEGHAASEGEPGQDAAGSSRDVMPPPVLNEVGASMLKKTPSRVRSRRNANSDKVAREGMQLETYHALPDYLKVMQSNVYGQVVAGRAVPCSGRPPLMCHVERASCTMQHHHGEKQAWPWQGRNGSTVPVCGGQATSVSARACMRFHGCACAWEGASQGRISGEHRNMCDYSATKA